MNKLTGIHHVTAITSSAEKNYQFFTYTLGMRLVKKTVNQDDIQINHMIDKLILLNPLNVMKKGCSIIYKDNNAISSVHDINENDVINIKLQDGNINAKVLEKR